MRLSLRFFLLLALGAVAAALVAGCGGSGDKTLSVGGGETIQIPGDVHSLDGEVEAILAQYPFQHWYVDCVVGEVRKLLSPKEDEELEGEPQAEREQNSAKVEAEARAACEKTDRPTINPNASRQEIQLLRVSSVPGIVELAESHGLDSLQVACVQNLFQKLPDKQIVTLHNGTDKAREGILVSVFKPCSRLK